ncbi:MAG: hypothetical protein ACI9H6_000437 [Patiriisocius sp.]|jgi:hypothetical protein
MSTLFMLFNVVVLLIGLMLTIKHMGKGWMSPPVLCGIAFVLIALPSVMAMLGL